MWIYDVCKASNNKIVVKIGLSAENVCENESISQVSVNLTASLQQINCYGFLCPSAIPELKDFYEVVEKIKIIPLLEIPSEESKSE